MKTKLSLAESSDYKSLVTLSKKHGFDPDKLRNLFWALNAPAKLHLIIFISFNLKKILVTLKKFPSTVPDKTIINEWIEAADFIWSHQHEISATLGDHVLSKELDGEVNQLHGKTLSTNPVYSIIINAPKPPMHHEKYRLLQGHIILAHAKLMSLKTTVTLYEQYKEKGSILGAMHSSVDSCCRFTRDLSKDANIAKLTSLSDYKPNGETQDFLTLPTQTFAKYIAPLRRKKRPPINKDVAVNLGVFFGHVYVDRGAKGKGGYSRQSSYRKFFNHDGITILSDSFARFNTTFLDDDPHIATIFEYKGNEDIGELDAPIDELSTGQERYLVYLEKVYRRPFASRYMIAQGEARRRAMNNQLLKGRWSTITLWEAATLHKLCISEFQREVSQLVPNELHLKTIILITTMMWTGSSFDVASNLQVQLQEDDQEPTESLTFLLGKNTWKVPNNLVHRALSPTDKQISASCPRSSFSFLEDLTGISILISKVITDSSSDRFIFSMYSSSELEKSMKQFLKKLPKGHRGSENNITNFLFSLIVNQLDHNVATACLVTASNHKLSNALLHYTTLPSSYLNQVYRKAVSTALSAIEKEVSICTINQTAAKPISIPEYIGSDLCPTTESIQNMVKALSKKISSTLKSRDTNSLIEHHNNYTVYVVLMMSYCLGLRAIQDAFITPDDIDHESGFVILSDKDNEFNYHSRLVRAPDLLLTQLKHYEEHRNYIINTVFLNNKKILNLEEIPYIFLLEDGCEPKTLKPKEVMAYISAQLPLPLNSNRRYLRSHFEQHDVPAEVISCFMGHWHLGEEPWSKYSSLIPSAYAKRVEPCHTAILKKLGWKAKRSRIFS